MGHQELTEEERFCIYGLIKAGYNQKEIAVELNRSPSTICREIARNSGQRGYRPKQAQELAASRKRNSEKHIKCTPVMIMKVTELLRKKWSPEQISNRLKEQGEESLSPERIYQLVAEDKKAGGDLYTHLRHGKKKRKKPSGTEDRRGTIKNRVDIDERPDIVEKRERIGDWEFDTIIGKNHKGALVTIVDRMSLKTLIAKVASKHAELVTKTSIDLLTPYLDITHTGTADNGTEFSGHEEIAAALDAKFYFAHPYSSWERGTNENTNGLIRQYIPKGSCLNDYSDEDIQFIEDALNNRPRKCLGYKTPNEVFESHLSH